MPHCCRCCAAYAFRQVFRPNFRTPAAPGPAGPCPSTGDDASAKCRRGMRPARYASRPASTACRMPSAMRTGSCARVTAEASITPAHPSSIASAASDAVPAPASRITGTRACSTISWKLCGLRMPSPEPMGDPSGMIAAQPTSSSFRASTGSSFVYGSTVKPSSTRVSAASSSSIGSGSSVRSSAMTSSLTRSVPSASRARRAVRTASPGGEAARRVGQHADAEPVEHGQHRAVAPGVHAPHRDRGQLGAGGDERALAGRRGWARRRCP